MVVHEPCVWHDDHAGAAPECVQNGPCSSVRYHQPEGGSSMRECRRRVHPAPRMFPTLQSPLLAGRKDGGAVSQCAPARHATDRSNAGRGETQTKSSWHDGVHTSCTFECVHRCTGVVEVVKRYQDTAGADSACTQLGVGRMSTLLLQKIKNWKHAHFMTQQRPQPPQAPSDVGRF